MGVDKRNSRRIFEQNLNKMINEKKKDSQEVLIASFKNELEAEMTLEFLKSQGIFFFY